MISRCTAPTFELEKGRGFGSPKQSADEPCLDTAQVVSKCSLQLLFCVSAVVAAVCTCAACERQGSKSRLDVLDAVNSVEHNGRTVDAGGGMC